ncbi:MAG TPA: NapC/NirT family cytochrome c [Candidatus Binatia bacterium]|jgi:nitrate/TMAO reductase-like tetraheme cytochrome c subunit
MQQPVAFVVGAVAAGGVIALLLRRNIGDSPSRHWGLLFGLAVLPSVALALGTVGAVNDAERPEFCGSCHIMEPWMHDLMSADSKTLAATHYKNRFILEDQCYTCHTDYAMFGPVKAKLDGVRHLLRYATGTYTLPIKIHGGSYHFTNCLRCHGESKLFKDKHEDLLGEGTAAELACLDCHGPVHPEQQAAR